MYNDAYGHEKVMAMAAKLGVAPTAPRVAGRQRHRANAPSPTAKECYRISVAAPFLDHIILELGERFDAVTVQLSRLLNLGPSVMNENQTKSQELQGVVDMYRDDLPCPQLFPAEFRRWRIKYAEEEELPGSCATALKQCDEDEFPNIFTLLKILSTLPATSCERSFSAMRRLNTCMRCTMSENRIASLALIHIHYDMQIDLEEVVELFATMHPRMVELSNLL